MSKQRDFWSRIFTFLPTPTASDGEAIDEKRLREEIDFQNSERRRRHLRVRQHRRQRLLHR